MMPDSLPAIAAWSRGTDLLMLIAAAFAVYAVSRIFDWTTGRKVRGHLDIIETDAHATAVYRGLRFIGICYLIGSLLK